MYKRFELLCRYDSVTRVPFFKQRYKTPTLSLPPHQLLNISAYTRIDTFVKTRILKSAYTIPTIAYLILKLYHDCRARAQTNITGLII